MSQNPDCHEVRPSDHGRALINPGMGWVHFHFDNGLDRYGADLAPGDAVDDFPGLSTAYFRLAWCYLEPEPGVYNWSLIDAPAQRWLDRGKRLAFRFTCCEGNEKYATPKWVFDDGARAVPFLEGDAVEPDYDDPIFLKHLERFIAAVAERYDGHPGVDFVDVGSMGIWGEGHTSRSTRLSYSADTACRHMDLWRKYFSRTLLVSLDDMNGQGRGNRSMEHARALGMSIRDDSILCWKDQPIPVPWIAEPFWPHVPVVLESAHYHLAIERDSWGDGSGYLEAIEQYHASYAGIHYYPRPFLEKNADLVDRINRRLGYRLRPEWVRWPKQVTPGQKAAIEAKWRNDGVAPCLPGGNPAYSLLDESGGVAATFVDRACEVRAVPIKAEPTGPFSVQPGAQVANVFVPPQLSPGVYRFCVSVGDRLGHPTIALPLEHDDGHRRYELGSIEVVAD